MEELLNYLISSIVNDPDAVIIEKGDEHDGITTYNVTVDPDDVGIVIGKKGKTIRAIRTLARLRGMQTNEKVRITLVNTELEKQPLTEEPSPLL